MKFLWNLLICTLGRPRRTMRQPPDQGTMGTTTNIHRSRDNVRREKDCFCKDKKYDLCSRVCERSMYKAECSTLWCLPGEIYYLQIFTWQCIFLNFDISVNWDIFSFTSTLLNKEATSVQGRCIHLNSFYCKHSNVNLTHSKPHKRN